MRNYIIVLFAILMPLSVRAQHTYGQTGLLHIPSGEMQADKTVMIGGNFMNEHLTPKTWSYDTYNYYVNCTIFPFLELNYVCTLFKARFLGVEEYVGKNKFTNQDRHFGARLRIVKEGEIFRNMPSIVIGVSDPYTESGEKINPTDGNGYFCRFYAAATKHINIGNEEIALTMAYLFNKRNEYSLNGIAAGVSYQPSFHKPLKIIGEYDTKDILVGASYLLFNHLEFTSVLQRFKYFSGGVAYKIYLK